MLLVAVFISVVLAYGCMSQFPHHVVLKWFSISGAKGELQEKSVMKAGLSKAFVKNFRWCFDLRRRVRSQFAGSYLGTAFGARNLCA